MLLETKTVEKPWGKDTLPAPFKVPAGKRIGEIWFEPPALLPELLVKYIFTSEKLSVQVHPSDLQTEQAGLGKQGKEECWLVIDAEPGAVLGMGFGNNVDSQTMREAALDGTIEELLVWQPVRPGDFFYIPANTVHAIGAGVSIIEIQQNSDITYRLYDYGRPRELHLNDAIAVAKGEPYDKRFWQHVPDKADVDLVDGPWFRLHQIDGQPQAEIAKRYEGPLLVIPREGEALVEGLPVKAGQCALAPALSSVEFAEGGSALITQPVAGAR